MAGSSDESKPAQPWVLSQYDRNYLKNLRIAADDLVRDVVDMSLDLCSACHGTGMHKDGLICWKCRGLGRAKKS